MKSTTAITACPLDCFGVCSFKVTCQDGEIIDLGPNTENPVTGNLICSKGRSHIARLNDPERVLEPLRRTADGWEPLSWDDALDFLTEKITAALETDGHHSIASYMGGGAAGKLKGVMELFFRHLGGGTVFSGGLCWSAGIAAQTADFGKVITHGPEDLLNARTLIFWGKNPADTHFHLLPWVTQARKNGCRVILVDPVSTATAGFADTVIRPLPGTDWALALAVIQSLLKAGLENQEAAAVIRAKEPLLFKHIEAVNPSLLLDYCGLTEEELRTLTDAYGRYQPCATYIGYGMQRHESGGSAVRLIDLLAYISGQIGIPGGGANYANKLNSDLFDWSWAEPGTPPEERHFQQGTMGPDLLKAANPPVRMLFIACGNPALQAPDSNAIAEAFKAIETVVVIDHFMTDTAMLADLILPATYFLEDEDLISSGMWNTTIHYTPQIVQPRGQSRSELRIFSALAERLGLQEFPQLSTGQWIQRLIRPLADRGVTLEQLKLRGWITSPNLVSIPWADQCFKTRDTRFNPIAAESVAGLIQVLPGNRSADTLPLISLHRRDSINSQHTRCLLPALPEALLHPDTAKQFDLLNGDMVKLANAYGSVSATVCVADAVRPGVVAMKQGSWKYEGEGVNTLSPSGVSDIGGQALLNAGCISITKILDVR